MSEKIIIYGKSGQVGSALAQNLQDNALIFSSTEYDFSDIGKVRSTLENIPVKAIINATAYTDVNKAESEEALAYKANALIPEALATFAAERHIPFIHYSTDYVFSGENDKPYKESDQTSPLNAYGRTKLQGEEKIQNIGGQYLIFRTSWVYNQTHKNFLNTMLQLATEREDLSVVSDQFGGPTYAPHLADATIKILEKTSQITNFPSGIYHLCNSGFISWHGFAMEIFDMARKNGITLKVHNVTPISSSDFTSPAKRPKNSRLDCSLVLEKFAITMPQWQEGLTAAIKLIAGK